MQCLETAAYTVGIATPPAFEGAAAEAILDEEHNQPRDFDKHSTDANAYFCGLIAEYSASDR